MVNYDDIESSIDTTLFGALAKRARLDLGYRRAEDFSEAIKIVTGMEVTKDAIYRIENGKKEPTVNYMLIMNIMQGRPLDDCSMMLRCIPESWKELGHKKIRYTKAETLDD